MKEGQVTPRQLSISTAFDYRLPIERQLPLIAAAGFSHLSLGEKVADSDYPSLRSRERLKALVRQHGLKIDTVHGPQLDQPGSIETLTALAEAAADLCVPVVVVHGSPFAFEAAELPGRLERLLGICDALSPVAARTGIVFALENVLPGPATDLVRLALPHLAPERFGFCYDSAHDQIGGPRPFDLLAELNERVVAVHLSDRVREFVDHVLPGEGFIDWESLTQELRCSSFAGPLLLEVMVTHSREKDAARFLKLAYERAAEIHDLVFTPKL